MTTPTITVEDIDTRITFHNDDEIMEVTFEDMSMANSVDVNLFYDRIEQRIAATGFDQWFFLVNYCNARIDPDAWFAFSRRGKELNLAHSMRSVRFDASEATLRQIKNAGSREDFDPNLYYDRAGALEALQSQTSSRVEQAKVEKIMSFTRADLNWRVEFLDEENTLLVDFSDMSLEHSDDVDLVYNFLEKQLTPLDRKWYFLVNYNGTRIQSPAWVQRSARSKALNDKWSLGSVRYAMGSETETDIRLRAESGGFRPNIRNTIKEAWDLINEMKANAESK
jgi:hypothetical protein